MPRVARTVVPGLAHHVTQRGNNRQDVFFVDDDRRFYLSILAEQCARYGLKVHGYCLMTNHVHLVVVPDTEQALAQAVGRTHFRYTQHVNHLHGRSGHLWQNRFYSCVLEDEHYWTAMRYVELNPVRARMVRNAARYRWSSAAAHLSGRDPTGLLDMSEWSDHREREDWQDQLAEPQEQGEIKHLRSCTRTGRPLGTDKFLSKLETLLGKRLRAAPVGRPPRKKRRPAKSRINR